MQYIPCNSALLAKETMFFTQKGTFLPKDLQKVRKSRQILIQDKIAYVECVWSGHQFPVRHITISFKSCLACKYWQDCEISGLCDEEAIV